MSSFLSQSLTLLKLFLLIRCRQKIYTAFTLIVIIFGCTSLFWISEFIKTLLQSRITDAGYYSYTGSSFNVNSNEIVQDSSANSTIASAVETLWNSRSMPANMVKKCSSCHEFFFEEIANGDPKQKNEKITVYYNILMNGTLPLVYVNTSEVTNYDVAASYIQMTIAEAVAELYPTATYTALKDIEMIKYIFSNSSDTTVSSSTKNISEGGIVIYYIVILNCMLTVALYHCRIFCQFKENRYLDLLYQNGMKSASVWCVTWFLIVVEGILIAVACMLTIHIQNMRDENYMTSEQLGMLVHSFFFMYIYIAAACLLFTSLLRRFIFVSISSVAMGTIIMVLMLVNQLVFSMQDNLNVVRDIILVLPLAHLTKTHMACLAGSDMTESYLRSITISVSLTPFVLIALLFYLDNVVSNGNGLKLNWNYLFNKMYWNPNQYDYKEDCKINNEQRNSTANENYQGNIEQVSSSEHPIINIDNVSKEYIKTAGCCGEESNIVAVDEYSCTIYKNQITGIIGHNGAGKTSLFKVMIGQEDANSGNVDIGKVRVTDPFDRLSLRGRLGVCEQFDVISPVISVWENIELMLISRGKDIDKYKDEIETLLKSLDLWVKKDVLGNELSGGQKRKVCTIMSLIGDPAVVFLDEPTSGLDPVSRRKMWTVLQKYKKGRSIILSTHFMDEADVLADRKIFMANGKLICAGSSLFLKHKFGCGPVLNISVSEKNNVENIVKATKDLCNDLHIRRVETTEIEASLPMKAADSLPALVKSIEKNSNITNVSLSQTTLDEIFIRIKDMTSSQIDELFNSKKETVKLASLTESPKLENEKNALHMTKVKVDPKITKQFTALFHLNMLRLKRKKMKLCCRIIFPLVLLLIIAGGIYVDKKNAFNFPNNNTVGEGRLKMGFCVGDTNDADFTSVNATVCPLKFTKSSSLTIKSFLESNVEMVFQNASSQEHCVSSRPCHFAYLSSWSLTTFNSSKGYFGFIMSQQRFRGRSSAYLMDSAINFLATYAKVPSNLLYYNRLVYRTYIDQFYMRFSPYVLIILMAILPVTYLSDPIEDKESKVRHQLSAMGMTSTSYWLNTFILHYIQYSVFFIIGVFILAVSFSGTYGNAIFLGCVFIVILLFGIPSNLLFLYFLGGLFKKPPSGIVITLFFVQLGLSLSVPGFSRDSNAPLVATWIWPPFAPMQLIYAATKFQGVGTSFHLESSVLDNLVGKHRYVVQPIVALIFDLFLFLALLCLVENKLIVKEKCQCCRGNNRKVSYMRNVNKKSDNEDGVKKEQQRVTANVSGNGTEDLLRVVDLQKTYSNGVVAVNGVTYGALSGEIFALLGPNGAGKSTTLSIVVGEEMPSAGQCQILYDHKYIGGPVAAARGAIGYCPQYNPLLEDITVTEHLTFYAKIRGVHIEEAKGQVEKLIDMLSLRPHATKRASQLSGGNKRRLCLAIGLLGNPSILVIDEASTGVDPETKRSIWEAIKDMATADRSVIITTHSMEEVEVLASRVGIMNLGQMVAFGTTNYLKQNYGETYSLEVLLKQEVDDNIETMKKKQDAVSAVLHNRFANVRNVEMLFSRLHYEIPKSSMQTKSSHKIEIASILEWINSQKNKLHIQYFSLYQASLDQIFVHLIKESEEESAKSDSVRDNESRVLSPLPV